jgi:small-conductance mechanosensitive channel
MDILNDTFAGNDLRAWALAAGITVIIFFLLRFVMVGLEFMGSVEAIGLKTTRIRSLSGEQVIFSNSDLLGSRVRNYGRMFERRVVFKLGVTYQTPRDRLGEIPVIVREAVEAQGDRVRQAIFLLVHEAFEDRGIEFAYPTQTLFVEKAD